MKKLLTAFLLGIMVVSSGVVCAESVCRQADVSWTGLQDFYKYSSEVDIYFEGKDSEGNPVSEFDPYYYAGTINLNISSTPPWQPPIVEAYCLELDTPFYGTPPYAVEICKMPPEYPFTQMGILVGKNPVTATTALQNTTGAAIQAAIWKLWYESNLGFGYMGESLAVKEQDFEEITALTFSPIEIDTKAEEMISDALAVGPIQFAIDVVPNAGNAGWVDVLVTGTTGIPGIITVALTTTEGSFVYGNGTGLFTNGYFDSIDLNGDSELTVTAVITVPTGAAFKVKATDIVNQDLIFFGPEIYYPQTSYRVTDDHLGNPRTIGFWKHQFKVAQTSRGNAQVDRDTLIEYIEDPIVFEGFVPEECEECDPISFGFGGIEPGENWDEDDWENAYIKHGFYLLWLKDATMRERALQQFFATMLNFLDGQIGMDAMVDIGYEIVPFSAALAKFCSFYEQGMAAEADGKAAEEAGNDAEAAEYYKAANEAYEAAKDICDSINNMMQD